MICTGLALVLFDVESAEPVTMMSSVPPWGRDVTGPARAVPRAAADEVDTVCGAAADGVFTVGTLAVFRFVVVR
ncbi:hypothetical protein Amme_078_007 [Acidomonas methanolica NBRC 104435]|uniref:Uncharacterized protein n=1 Tax=Acidomonas methanolica NBRC 104435 TaxID=1231351 RepID=A0A023D7R4_ACIMT|nr:hypothetical protein Amme_078_007 [Acidomonas methanolica NBRC 104435]GEL00105.1 hypothetical protein AME01nite_26030 [Acidomonas methanolica NBRC 104435]